MIVGVFISHIQLLMKYMKGFTVHTQFWSLTVNEPHQGARQTRCGRFQVEQKPARHQQEPDLSTLTALYMER